MATQDSRIKIKRSTITGTVPTVPSSNDHTDGTWIATDIYKGELFFNQADGVLWSRDDNGINCLGGSASLTISSADVLTLNSTPLTIVGAVSGYAIEVISASISIDFNTTPYTTETSVYIMTTGAILPQYKLSVLDSTVSRMAKFDATIIGGTTDTQIISNSDILVQAGGVDPTAGDSDITVYVNYRLIPA